MKVLRDITEAGTSIWLDDLSRERLAGSLAQYISQYEIRGVTTNPAIFSAAISGSDLYREDIKRLAGKGLESDEIIEELTTDDVRRACDLFKDLFHSSGGVDGRVSIEVDPALARNREGTISEGLSLQQKVDRPNLLVKVPATTEGLSAITRLTEAGVSVNVTLIFSLSRYREVIDAYAQGLERRLMRGEEISRIHSVASFFVSRVDTEVDARLAAMDEKSGAIKLRGQAAVANAVLAYRLFEEESASDRWRRLTQSGANLQRPLWASTGVKDPAYRATLYVDSLVAPQTVNTMPDATLKVSALLAGLSARPIQDRYQESDEVLLSLSERGVNLEEVAVKLEDEGLKKFLDPWVALGESVKSVMRS
ncbi:MAG: transaldolase [Actinomycetota bacterium]